MKKILSIILLLLCNVTLAEPTLIPSDKLFTHPTNHNGNLSPDGKYFSYITKEDTFHYLLFIDLDSHQVLTALEVPEKTPITSYLWLSNDALWVTFIVDNEEVKCLINLQRVDNDDESSIKIDYVEINTGYIVDVLIDEPEFVLFSRIEIKGANTEQTLYHISLEQLKKSDFENAQVIEEKRDDVIFYSLDQSYSRLIGSFFDGDSVISKFRELNDKKWTFLFSSEDDTYEDIKPVAFIDDTTLAVLTNKNSDKIGLYRFDLKKSQLQEALYIHDQYDLIGAGLTSEGNMLYVEYVENGKPRTEWLESFSRHITARFNKTFKGDVPLVIASNLSGNRLLLLVHGANNSGRYYVYKKEDDLLMHVLSLYPEIEKYTYPTHSTVTVKAEDGTEIEAYLTKPKGIDHNTLLVMPHGGPIGVRDYNLFSPNVQYLANRGFTILRVNFRGSEGFGKKFKDQGVGEFGKQIEADISLVVDKVLNDEKYDHVCAIGSSYGAYSSMMLSIKHPELYECIIASYGVYDLPLLFNYSNLRTGEDYEKYIARTVGENTSNKKETSPLYQAQNINIPVLLIAGKKDQITGFEQSNRMRYVLEKQGKDVESIFYEKAGHGHTTWYGDQHQYAYTVEFLIKVLKLEPLHINNLSEDDIKALTHDYTVIADGFDTPNLVEDIDISVAYTRLASQFGEKRITFNLGSKYHRGDGVEMDINKAIEYYQLAAEQGYLGAYRRLTEIYLEGVALDRNDELAFKYLTLALEHVPSNKNKQLMARFYCIAGDKFKSVEKCISMFKKQMKSVSRRNKEDVNDLHDNLARSLIGNSFTEEERKSFKKVMVDEMGLTDPDFDFELEYAYFARYESNEVYRRSGKHIAIEISELPKLTKEIEAKNISLRLSFLPDHSGIPSRIRPTFALVNWQEFSADGKKVNSSWSRKKASAKNNWVFSYTVKDYVPGNTFKVTVYDAAGHKKFTKEFK